MAAPVLLISSLGKIIIKKNPLLRLENRSFWSVGSFPCLPLRVWFRRPPAFFTSVSSHRRGAEVTAAVESHRAGAAGALADSPELRRCLKSCLCLPLGIGMTRPRHSSRTLLRQGLVFVRCWVWRTCCVSVSLADGWCACGPSQLGACVNRLGSWRFSPFCLGFAPAVGVSAWSRLAGCL